MSLVSRLGRLFRRESVKLSHYSDSHVFGRVEGLSDERIVGWAFSSLSPRRRLSIVVKDGGAILAHGLADQYRADVDQAHAVSDGCCGFSIALPQSPWSALRVEVDGFALELPGAPTLSARDLRSSS